MKQMIQSGQSGIKRTKTRHSAAAFNQLSGADQKYMETLTARLAALHETSPETRFSTGKKPAAATRKR